MVKDRMGSQWVKLCQRNLLEPRVRTGCQVVGHSTAGVLQVQALGAGRPDSGGHSLAGSPTGGQDVSQQMCYKYIFTTSCNVM